MKRAGTDGPKNGIRRWSPLYVALLLAAGALLLATALWLSTTNRAQESTINDLGEFYLEEITERNTGSISSELNKKAGQMRRALTLLEQDYLSSESAIRRFIYMVQKINGLDIFALVDADGMVYTADNTFSGISRFGFLSDEITEPGMHMVKSYGTRTMIIISTPVRFQGSAGIEVVCSLTGLNIESLISTNQLQSESNKTYCRIFTREGENLIRIQGEYPDGVNLFDRWAEMAEFAPGYSMEKVRDDWANGREGYTVYRTQSGESTYVYYKNVPGTDIMLTTLMRESNINAVVGRGVRSLLHSSVLYLVFVVIVLLAMCAIIVVMARRARLSQQENEQFKVVGALSNDYSDIYLMEPGRDQSTAIKRDGRLLGYDRRVARSYRETWARYVERCVLEEDAKGVLEAVAPKTMAANFKGAEEYTLDFRTRQEGALHYCQVKFVPLAGDDGQYIVGFKNSDAQVRAEQERQKVLQDALAAAQHASRAKTTFLNNVSHDIRTPMNAIIGYTTLAASHVDRPEQVQDYLGKIQTASNHLMSLINDVLDMSRIESGKVKIEEQEVHLPDLIHSLRTIVQADINAKQLEFFIDTVDVINEDVICDRLRLNQILLNLLSNAMKFTQPGGMVSLRILQRAGAPAGCADYEFRVKDNGIGMSPEFQEHIFEAFTREHSSTVSGIQGTGLGMAITKSILDIMGGTIRVSSELGKGTEFTVNLRLQVCGRPVQCGVIPEVQGLRALVADDDANTCMSVASMLGAIGMRTEWTTTGKEAVLRTQFAIQQSDEFHAYIIDWLMPDMNGIEVVRRIRRIIGEGDPIIILTAYDWSEIEDEAREAGVTAFCSKPLFMSELREIFTKPCLTKGPAQDAESLENRFAGKRLLLVEDNALNREIAQEILENMGFEIDVAVDGEEAVERMAKARSGQYDLILMDIQMPHMNGYEATRRIRAMEDAALANIPIIAMTANAFEEDRKDAISAGMDGHVAKPIEIPRLVEALKEFID